MKAYDCSVLIIDDVSSVRDYLRQTLHLLGVQRISDASNGSNALSCFSQGKPDVIFLDIELPDCDGKNLLRQFKELNPDTHVVIMTAHSTVENVQQSILAGASGFVAKPFSAKKIESVLNKCTQHKAAARVG
jgi:two-component system chemotaxis response regulator CheY